MSAGGEEKAIFVGLKNDAQEYLPQAAHKAAQFAEDTSHTVDQGVTAHLEGDAQLGRDMTKIGDHPPEETPVQSPTQSGDPFKGRGVGSQAETETKNLAAETDQEAVEGAHLDGEGGATDDPIDLVTGEMFLPQQDLALSGVLPLALERRHGSAYRHGRCFGVTWASTLDQRVEIDDDGIHLALEDGRVLHYPVPTVHGQKVMPSHGPRWPLAWDRTGDVIAVELGDRGWTLHFPPGPTPRICRPLAAITDLGGNRITFVHDSAGIPTDVYHSGGYHLRVDSIETRGGVRVSAVKLADPSGGRDTLVRAFRYDLAGRLTGVVNASGLPLVFDYDEHDRITRWVDRNGFEYRYTYRADGRVVRGSGTGGYLDVALDYDLDARITTVTDALGHATVHYWNARQQTVKTIDPLGHEQLIEKDRFGRVTQRTDQSGQVTRIERDDFGDPVRITRPDGTGLAISYTEHHQPAEVVEADGVVWRYAYAESGALAAVTDPTGAVARYERDEHGRLTAVTDPLGAVSTIACNAAGLPIRAQDPLGAAVEIQRDAFGRITTVTDPTEASTTLSWTVDGQLAERRSADGSVERWEYDPEGSLLAYTSPHGAVTRYEYGPFEQVLARIEPDGARYQFAYDGQLRLTEVTGPTGRSWRYEYDAVGNLISETDFNGATHTYELDATGRLARQTNPVGQQILYTRDALGRVTERQVGAARYRFTYDAAGTITRAEGPDALLEYTRDAVGRILTESIDGRVTSNTYDANGQRVTRITPSGILANWTYDVAGKPTALDSSAGRLSFDYDAAGRETTRSLGSAASLTQSFDELGQLTGQAIWAYEQPGSQGGQAQWRAVQTRSYTYRADGLPTEIDDALRGNRSLSLDPRGRVTSVTGANWRETYAYDELGNLTATADEHPGTPAADSETADAGRAIDGTLVRRVGPTSYDYDQAGRLIRKHRRTLSGGVKEWIYAWDAENRLRQVTTPDGTTWRYSYDPLGRRTAKHATAANGAPGATVVFNWDGDRLAEAVTTTPDGNSSALTWDYQPGTYAPVTQFRRSWAADAPQDQIDAEFHAIVTDLVGTPTELIDPNGRVSWHTTSSLWGRTITAPDSTTECPLRFPGQYQDAESGLHYNYHRYYDPETGAYLSPDPLGLQPSPNPQTYVENPLGYLDPLGLTGCRYQTGNGATPDGDPWDDLAAYRAKQGMPAKDTELDEHTASRLDIDGQSFYGRNGHGMPTDIKVNAQTKTHAEGQSFQRAKNFFGGNAPVKEATLYVDRNFCKSCGPYGGVGSLMRGLGIDRLTVHSPAGTFMIDATKRPSIPRPVPEP